MPEHEDTEMKIAVNQSGIMNKNASALENRPLENGKASDVYLLTCDECPFNTNKPGLLRAHCKGHKRTAGFKCPLCTYCTEFYDILTKHMGLHAANGSADSVCDKPDKPTAAFKKRTGVKNPSVTKKNDLLDQHTFKYKVRSNKSMRLPAVSCPNLTAEKFSIFHDGKKDNLQLQGKYTCSFCGLRFKDHTKLVVHRNIFHPLKSSTQCKKEDSGANSFGQITEKRPRCKICPFYADRASTVSLHMKFHRLKSKYQCEFCSFSCDNMAKVIKHETLHTTSDSKNLLCLSNRKRLDNFKEDRLKVEVERIEESDTTNYKRFCCKLCPYWSESHHDLNQHAKQHQVGQKYTCQKCNFSAGSLVVLGKHKMVHKEKLQKFQELDSSEMISLLEWGPKKVASWRKDDILMYSDDSDTSLISITKVKCDECPHQAQTESLMRVHRRLHKGKRPFSCPRCTFSCNHRETLQHHLELHSSPSSSWKHISNRSNFLHTTLAGTCEKKLKCPRCTFRGASPETYVEHLARHLQDDRWKKSVKVKQPKRTNIIQMPETVAGHVKLMETTDNLRYFCSKCSFQCETAASLFKHMDMHGNKDGTYMCSICDYRCRHMKVVRFHEQNHHAHIPFSVLFSGKQQSDKLSLQDSGEKQQSRPAVHPDETVLHCTLCEFSSTNSELMKCHWNSHCQKFWSDAKINPEPNMLMQQNETDQKQISDIANVSTTTESSVKQSSNCFPEKLLFLAGLSLYPNLE